MHHEPRAAVGFSFALRANSARSSASVEVRRNRRSVSANSPPPFPLPGEAVWLLGGGFPINPNYYAPNLKAPVLGRLKGSRNVESLEQRFFGPSLPLNEAIDLLPFLCIIDNDSGPTLALSGLLLGGD